MSEDESTRLAEDRTDKAVERTRLAEDRTLLANERTFAGWARTAMASIGLGLGFQALFKTTEPTWIAKLIATLFIALGVFIVWAAWQRASQVLERKSENEVSLMRPGRMLVMAIGTSLGGVALVAALWFYV